GVGDSHYWEVWHGKGDWKHYEDSTSRFCSEFGFASSPSLYAWSKTISEGDWRFDSEAVKWHDKTAKGYEKYISLIELHYPKIETLEDLVYYSQLNQRDALRHGIEHYLRSEFCRGTLIWQFNDCWPAQSWAVQDSEGRMKPAAAELMRMYLDQVLSILVTEDEVQFWLTNNGDEPASSDIVECATVMQTDGRDFRSIDPAITPPVTVEPTQSAMVASYPRSGLDAENVFALGVLNPSWAWDCPNVRFLCEPKDVRLSCEKITVHINGTSVRDVATDVPIFDLWLYDPDDLGNVSRFCSDIIGFVPPRGWDIYIGAHNIEFSHEPNRLVARSLAGCHEVEISRSRL
ncbi:MAG: hypothetical protein IH945_11405, partial [Armatimonadetes bacterium]|nr:hypothetical protein [Armatimonadota bacterium]